MAVVKRTNKNHETHYQVRVRDPSGRWQPSKTFDSRTDARLYEKQLLSKVETEPDSQSDDNESPTFQEYWAKWSSECRGHISLGWKMTQDQMARDYLMPFLGKKKLIEIKRQDVGNIITQLSNRGALKRRTPARILRKY